MADVMIAPDCYTAAFGQSLPQAGICKHPVQ
jgi:hypothetical protein